ncbi:MAG: dicarboxylate/amino acid:cation symporter [Rickettsiales bacterium]
MKTSTLEVPFLSKKRIKLALWQQIIIGLVSGLGAAYFLGEKAANFKFLGTIFISLIKMVIVPLIFFSVVTAITNMRESKSVSKIAIKSVLTFLLSSVFAVSIGIITALFLTPGSGKKFTFLKSGVESASSEVPKISDILINIVPNNIFNSFAEGNILQIVLFSCLIGTILNLLGEKTEKVTVIIKEISFVFLKMIEIVVLIAPFGVFGYISWTVGTQGFGVLLSLVQLISTLFTACFIQYLVFGIFIIVFARINPIPFYKKMLEPQIVAFSTSSSKATLSTTMRTLREKLGVSENSINFVLPIGSSINMDGGAIYLAVCTMFFAQATGLHFEFQDYCTLVFMCTLGSIGAAGIPGGILLFLGITFKSLGLPTEAVAIIISLDCVLDMMTTVINVTGDACVTLVIDNSEKQLNYTKYYSSTKTNEG